MKVTVVLGLGFGDEGKGALVDWLVRRDGPALVVRWNGGPQAAHHVVTDDGRVHCFAQLGSGSFVPGARTHLGPDLVVDPYALHVEARALARAGVPDALAGVTLDPRAVVVTPWHALLGRVRELLRGDAAHGTTGRGVAEARLDAERPGGACVRAGRLEGFEAVRAHLRRVAAALVTGAAPEAARALVARMDDADLADALADAVRALAPAGVRVTATPPAAERVVLEGAHGALLDRDHGFFPHVTPSRITRAAAERALADMGLPGPDEVWGVLRAYHTRHGAGPFPSESAALDALLPEAHNDDSGFAGRFRRGWFDAVLARWALRFAGPVDRLAVTCVDRIEALGERLVVDGWASAAELESGARTEIARRARVVGRRVERGIVDEIEAVVGRRVDVESWGPTAGGKRERRATTAGAGPRPPTIMPS